MKIPFLTCLLALGSCAMLHAQAIKAPDSLQPGTGPRMTEPSTAEVDKLAEEAQRALFDAAGKESPMTSTSSSVGGPTLVPGGSMRLPSPVAGDPSLWAKDSYHKLAIVEIAYGGNRDSVTIELFPDAAPQTVANFINHSDSGLYNGLAFHRAIEGFLVQTGDPLTSDESARQNWGTGGEDKTLPSEIKRSFRIGSVAMARRSDKVNPSRRSNGSQFFITLGNHASLDGKYTVFGQVVSGLAAVKNIAQMPVDANDCPIARIEVKSIKIQDHRGPLQVQSETLADGKKYKPTAPRGFVGRFLNRVW